MRDQVEQRIRENWNLVPYTIERYFLSHLHEKDEMMAVGLIALWKAAEKFDPSVSPVFSQYAVRGIRNEIKNYLTVTRRHHRKTPVSLDESYAESGDPLAEIIEDPNEPFDEQIDHRLTVRQMVDRLLSRLKDKDREMIERYFGLTGKPQTLQQLAEVYGVSHQAVHKKIHRLLAKLQRIAQKEGLA